MLRLKPIRGRRSPEKNPESGMALVAILAVTGVMLLFALSVLMMASIEAGLTARRACKSRAFYLAEGGLTRGMLWMEAQDAPPEGTATIHPFGAEPDTVGSGTYYVEIVPDPTNGTAERPAYTIVSTGNVNGHDRTLHLRVGLGQFTDYLYFTDREHEPGSGAPLWFDSYDVLDGPVFTNDQISIHGDPTFMYHVASAYGGPDDDDANHDPLFLYYNGDPFNNIESAAAANPPYDNPDFQEGYELGVPSVDYPDHNLTNDIEDLADMVGLTITGTHEIVLSRIDAVSGLPMYGYVSYRQPGFPWTDVEISSINGLLFVNGSFSVSGVLDGALTLASNGSIWVTDDVTYRDSDEDGPNPYCDDMLGLISGTDINISMSEANMNDCVIHAAMVALDNCFRADQWSSGPLRGLLTVRGCIVQGYHGAVNTTTVVDGEEILLTGYATDYGYDWRLLEDSPPYFHEFFGMGNYVRGRWREVES